MEIIGKVLASRYEILEKIGEGGMATVYKARCNLLNRYVAIKVLREEYASDETFVKRFRTEAQSAASLTHPNIVSVYDVGEEDGINYIVMELLETKTLKDYIEEKGSLPNELTLKIAAQIASALEAAHKAHIIHRDIKPHNIVLNKNMVAKVTDFGIAKITNTPSATITSFGSTMGSVHYFSPEHAKGGYTDERSDIYSLGVVMYEMATAKLPFDATSPVSVALKHIQEQPIEPIVRNPNVSVSLNQIILKAMEKNTINRYQNATEILRDISQALDKPNMMIIKPSSFVEAGATQVIPIINDSLVPNLRTRQANKTTIVTGAKEIEADYEEIDADTIPNLNKQDLARQKKNKKLIIIICIIVCVLIFSGGVFLALKNKNSNNIQVQQIEIPDIVGKPYEDIASIYKEKGIEILQDKLEYNSDQVEGNIISQTPLAKTMSLNKKIYVVVSKGQKLVEVADVTGKDIKVATYELADTAGFKIEQEDVINEKVAAGIVISQTPKEGKIAVGSTIKLTVSKGDGKASVLMPSVLTKSETDAKKILQDLKFVVTIKYGEDSAKANGVVISQNYPQNQELKEGALVEITVNKLIINKIVNLDLLKLQGGKPLEDVSELKIKVTASLDGAPVNSVYEKTHDITDASASFEINGYKTANLKIYLNDKLVDEQKLTF
ncbi:MAG: Stk1 family PASTA domain-containing Ser/Thr kinase [Clostridia bacterium]